tara:strand:+ start:79 stop:837 length:759 start_codon:yes stop_codon:yes gene_type:complete
MNKKVVIITGAGNGIGRATAVKFANSNANVVIADLHKKDGYKTKSIINEFTDSCTFVNTNMSIESDVIKLVETSINLYGHIDIIINNAAAFTFSSIENTNSLIWDKAIQTNLIGYSNLIKYSLPYLKKQKDSNIVNVGSVSSFIAQENFLPYSASKAAVRQLSKCLALDLGKYNIRVNCISPGPIFTNEIKKQIRNSNNTKKYFTKIMLDKTVLKRIGKPEDVADAIFFLASDNASFITGVNLVIDGGSTIK